LDQELGPALAQEPGPALAQEPGQVPRSGRLHCSKNKQQTLLWIMIRQLGLILA